MKKTLSAADSKRLVRTMQDVEDIIAERQAAMSANGFLTALSGPGDLDSMRRVAPRVAFFVFGFQDVLRLVRDCTTDSEIKPIAVKHAREDAGHELWYLGDLDKLGVSVDAPWLFSPGHQVTRDVVYAQVAEVIRAKHDHTRLAVALCLEALAAVYFDRAKQFLERISAAEGLVYFGGHHLEAERGHELFEAEAHRNLSTIPVPAEATPELLGAIDRVFAGMADLSLDLERAFHGT